MFPNNSSCFKFSEGIRKMSISPMKTFQTMFSICWYKGCSEARANARWIGFAEEKTWARCCVRNMKLSGVSPNAALPNEATS